MQINTVSLVGRLGRDPEIKYFESGKVKTWFSIAVNNPFKKNDADWFNIVLWGKPAETAATYCKKGGLVGITGRVEIERWNDTTTGAERSKPTIVGDNLYLLGSKQDQQQTQANNDNDQNWDGGIDF